MNIDKNKTLETSLVLTTGFLVLYFVTKAPSLLYVALGFGIVGIFIKPLAKYIAIAWFKLADILNFVMSKIVLGTIFYVILFPISVLYRLAKNDKLQLRNPKKTNWIERNYQYKAADLKNIW